MSKLVKSIKKLFTWSVVTATTAWSMGLSLLVPSVAIAVDCPELEAGDLFKVPNNSAVYLVNADMERMYFPNSEVYETWFGTDFSAVVEIPNACVDNYPSGGGVNYRPGSRLVKVVISPNVFAIGPGNMKHKVADPATAEALYGANWASLVRDLPDVFDANLKRGDDLGGDLHDGQLVTVDGAAIYYVWNGMLKMVDGDLGSHISGDVRTVSQAALDALEMADDNVTPGSVTNDPGQGGTATNDGGSDDSADSGSTGTLTISLAADTQSGGTAVTNAARVSFTKVNLTASGGDVTVDSFKVARMGTPAVDGDFSKINVVDWNGNLLSSAGKTLNADHLVTFTEDLDIPSGSTRSITLVADMGTVGTGNSPTLALYSVDTDSTVVGSLPLQGNPISTNANITLGTVTLAEGTNLGNTRTEQVGDTDIDLVSLKVTTATQGGELRKVVIYNNGTASLAKDVENLELTYQNDVIATGVVDGKYVTFDLANCGDSCAIEKNKNKTFEVRADLINGSARTLDMYIKNATDVLFFETNSDYFLTPTNNAADSNMSNELTIDTGNVTVSKTNDVVAGNIPGDASDLYLGSWNFKVQGEPITFNKTVFKITTTGTIVPTGLDALVLEDANGNALTGSVDGVGGSSPGYATSTDSFTLPVGDNILRVKANVDSTAVAEDTIQIGIDINGDNADAEGVQTGEAITLGTNYNPNNTTVSGNTMTVKTAALRVTTLSTPAARTLAAGTNDVEVAHVLLDASNSSEDVKVTQVIISDATGAAAKTIDMQNVRIFVDKDGDSFDGSGSDVALSLSKSGSDTDAGDDQDLTFALAGDDQFVVKAGKKLKLTFKADIAGSAVTGATATHTFSVDTANDVAAVGVTTGNTVTEIIDSASGQALTVGAAGGQIQVSKDESMPIARIFAAGTTGVTLASFNVLATTTENVELEKILLTMRETDTSSSSFSDYTNVYFEDEAGNVVGSVVPTSTTALVEFNDGAFVADIDDTDGAVLNLKANLASISTQGAITVGGHRLGFNIANKGHVTAKGAQSGTGSNEYLSTGSAPNGNTHYAYKAYPTIEKIAVNSNLSNGTVDLFKFKVTANGGDVGLYKMTFDITTTTASVTSVELLDVTDSNEVSLHSDTSLENVAYINALFDTNSSGVNAGGEERTVSKTKPRTYVLRGTVSGSASGASVSTRLAGDAAEMNGLSGQAALMDAAVDADGHTHDDFIWSDRSVGAHGTTTNDWVNGYLVSGLNSASSTPSVVSQ